MAEAFDPTKGKLAWSIRWDTAWVTAVSFVGSARKLAAGNQLGQLFLWDLPEKPDAPAPAPCRRLDGHNHMITALAATPDGKKLISTSYDHSVRIWDMAAAKTGTDSIVLDPREREKAAKEAASKGKVPTEAPSIQVDLQRAERTLSVHTDWVRGLSLTPDGTRLLTGDDRGQAILWNVADGKELRRLKVPGWIAGAALSADARLAVTCEFAARYAIFPNVTRLWDLESGEAKLDLTKQCPNSAVVAISPDIRMLALGTGGEDYGGKLYLVETATGKKVREMKGHEGSVVSAAFHPSGQFLATGGRDTLVRLWQISDGKMIKELGQSRGGQFKDFTYAISFSPDGQWLAAADMGGFVHVWSFAS